MTEEKKKRTYAARVPATSCPHCRTRAIAYDSVEIDILTREIRYVCQDADCGHTFVAQLGIFRTVRPSMKPNMLIKLPHGQWRSKPAPANDDAPTSANDDEASAAEALPAPG